MKRSTQTETASGNFSCSWTGVADAGEDVVLVFRELLLLNETYTNTQTESEECSATDPCFKIPGRLVHNTNLQSRVTAANASAELLLFSQQKQMKKKANMNKLNYSSSSGSEILSGIENSTQRQLCPDITGSRNHILYPHEYEFKTLKVPTTSFLIPCSRNEAHGEAAGKGD